MVRVAGMLRAPVRSAVRRRSERRANRAPERRSLYRAGRVEGRPRTIRVDGAARIILKRRYASGRAGRGDAAAPDSDGAALVLRAHCASHIKDKGWTGKQDVACEAFLYVAGALYRRS